MKAYSLLFVLFLISSCRSNDPQKWSRERMQRYDAGIKCQLGTKYDVEKRRLMFPFNKAKKILVIAYRNFEVVTFIPPKEAFDTILVDGKQKIVSKIVHIPTLCEQKEVIKTWNIRNLGEHNAQYCVIESVDLSLSQMDSLSNLLFNFELNKSPWQASELGCYTPRNSVLFLGENEEVIATIEICFECRNLNFSFEKQDERALDSFCPQQQESLRAFFSSIGIKYGVNERE